MKVIPTKELIKLLDMCCPRIASKDTVDDIFKSYGDDYFKEPGISDYELTTKNIDRVQLLDSIKCKSDTYIDKGELIQILHDMRHDVGDRHMITFVERGYHMAIQEIIEKLEQED